MNILNGMFGKIATGLCRLSVSGGIAIKTSAGYKTYNTKNQHLTNCDNFVFDIGEEFFFLIPTNKVKVGDIILVSNKPKCVIEVEKNRITAINYEDSTVETIIPEHNIFMGNTYFYSKIVSMFGNDLGKGKGIVGKMISYMMMSEMMKSSNNSSFNPALWLMMSGKTNMFEDMFSFKDMEEDLESEEI